MNKKPVRIAPSILSADFGRLAEESRRIEQASADEIHIDIMDGLFVKNLTMGPKTVAAINKATSLFLDVHLMIYNPYEYIEQFVAAGADRITFHFEATEDVADTLNYIRRAGIKAGLAFSPETSVELMAPYLDQCDQLLLMSVNPGFGGQSFMPEVIEKIAYAHKAREIRQLNFDIQVDGGIDNLTAAPCIAAGADALVSGTFLFNAPNMKAAIDSLKKAPA
jgi:ribulose-phosphate 3-epimerase